jgi:hypothetical protein
LIDQTPREHCSLGERLPGGEERENGQAARKSRVTLEIGHNYILIIIFICCESERLWMTFFVCQ